MRAMPESLRTTAFPSPDRTPESVSERAFIQPLDDFYRRGGRTLLSCERIEEDSMPEPYRRLLVHQRDMTRTLEQFHHGSIHLRVLSSRRDGNAYWRESILQIDGSGRPVEYGAIKIYLLPIPEPARSLILAEHLPLGGILNTHGLKYTSHPSAYFRCEPDAFISTAFGIEGARLFYGRQNTLRFADGNLLAEIVEILPPD
jgi:hypothetical protein